MIPSPKKNTPVLDLPEDTLGARIPMTLDAWLLRAEFARPWTEEEEKALEALRRKVRHA